MRIKDEILKEMLINKEKAPKWDSTASLHERLTLEVLIDIRDTLVKLEDHQGNTLIDPILGR